jgi:hypothetical protein
MKNKNLPIGYWIKHLDHLLTEGINKIQNQFGLTRSDWQVLNCLSEQSKIEKENLLEIMKPLANATTIKKIIWHY